MCLDVASSPYVHVLMVSWIPGLIYLVPNSRSPSTFILLSVPGRQTISSLGAGGFMVCLLEFRTKYLNLLLFSFNNNLEWVWSGGKTSSVIAVPSCYVPWTWCWKQHFRRLASLRSVWDLWYSLFLLCPRGKRNHSHFEGPTLMTSSKSIASGMYPKGPHWSSVASISIGRERCLGEVLSTQGT